ncbi:amidase family protein [Cupriavidus basilensis]
MRGVAAGGLRGARLQSRRGGGSRVSARRSMAASKQATASDILRRQGVVGRLSGLPISVKDLFDVQGDVTRAGARVLPEQPATVDAVAIARLRAAGAVFVGRTNMTEFAYSGVGTNPHHGTPRNPFERAVGRIPGGSSSGAAVSVTDGMAVAAIGSDTGGSCRVPAALCGIAGFKPTARRVPLQGTVPLSSPAMTRSVAWRRRLLAAPRSTGSWRGNRTCCVGSKAGTWPSAGRGTRNVVLDGLSGEVASAYERALGRLAAAGALLREVAFDSWNQLPELGINGGLVAAEASAWHAGRGRRPGGSVRPASPVAHPDGRAAERGGLPADASPARSAMPGGTRGAVTVRRSGAAGRADRGTADCRPGSMTPRSLVPTGYCCAIPPSPMCLTCAH